MQIIRYQKEKSKINAARETIHIYSFFQEGNTNKRHIMQNYNIRRGTLSYICSELWSTPLDQYNSSII